MNVLSRAGKLHLSRGERIAGVDLAGIQAALEPLHALLRRSVREILRAYVAGGHLLQLVVPYRSRCLQGRLDVALIDYFSLLGGFRPHARKAIGLESNRTDNGFACAGLLCRSRCTLASIPNNFCT